MTIQGVKNVIKADGHTIRHNSDSVLKLLRDLENYFDFIKVNDSNLKANFIETLFIK